jgi:hypothetical protein
MKSPARERNHLAQADRHIRAVKRHIYDQERLIERLADQGQSTDDAFVLLNLLTQSLRQLERHRRSAEHKRGSERIPRDSPRSRRQASEEKKAGPVAKSCDVGDLKMAGGSGSLRTAGRPSKLVPTNVR